MPRGLLAAQVTHAAGESSPGNLPEGTYAVVLAAKSPEQLIFIEKHLIHNGVPHKAIRENDPPYRGELLAIGVTPQPRSQLRRYFSTLPLLK